MLNIILYPFLQIFLKKICFFFIATAWEVSLVFEKPVRLRTCPHADNVLINMLLRKCFSKIVTRIFFKHQSFFLLIVERQKSHGTKCPKPKKLSAKRKSPVDRKHIFYLSVLFNSIIIKNSRGIFLKSQRKTVKLLRNRQFFRKSSRHVKPQNLNRATVCRWLSGLSESLCNMVCNGCV